MQKKYLTLVCALFLVLACVSCGGADKETVGESDTESIVEGVNQAESETETASETETETEANMEYIRHDTLVPTETDGNPSYDSASGLLTVRFDDPYIIYKEGEPCDAVFSGDGAAYLLNCSIDMAASEAFLNEEGFYSGVAVKLSAGDESVPVGTYKVILEFSTYTVTVNLDLPTTIG